MRRRQLLARAGVKFLAGLLLAGALLFIPAGTLRFWQAWLLLCALFAPMLAAGLFLWRKAPALLEKRLNSRERETTQRWVVAFSALVFILGFAAAGLDFRYGWSQAPRWLSIAAAVLLFVGYALYLEVMRENAFLSRTVEVQPGQHVVDSGLYGVVRHPMYAATLLLYLAMPLVLGSYVSLLVFLAYPPLIVRRIRNEEAVLAKGLAGYTAYQQRVKYRLLPYIW